MTRQSGKQRNKKEKHQVLHSKCSYCIGCLPMAKEKRLKAQRKAVATLSCARNTKERKGGRGSQRSESFKKYRETRTARIGSRRSLPARRAASPNRRGGEKEVERDATLQATLESLLESKGDPVSLVQSKTTANS